MRHVMFCLLFATPILADEKPNTLSAKQIEEGWLLLFDGETTFGWATEGEVSAKDGLLKLGGTKASKIELRVGFPAYSLAYEASSNGTTWGQGTIALTAPGVGESKSNDLTLTGSADGKFSFTVPANKVAYLRSVRLQPTKMTSLFNGKDLAGWKVFAGEKYKSKFTVTKEGWLNVKDGPGDLQTEAQWADFVVQLECISNGKHLNSGLFFRGIPDQYQQGYEAQIRNQWEGEDRSKPVDFGTGAIYRRQPARKVVSTDGEWFTLTVVATGRYLATWVNGYPVASWTDDREEKDNARQGAKLTKGVLSIQGHDPTTDLLFRNLRLFDGLGDTLAPLLRSAAGVVEETQPQADLQAALRLLWLAQVKAETEALLAGGLQGDADRRRYQELLQRTAELRATAAPEAPDGTK